MQSSLVYGLNALAAALFLMTVFLFLASRQTAASLSLFVRQALLLSASALLQAYALHSLDLLLVALITIAAKAFIIPWMLRRSLGASFQSRREVELAVSVPTSLVIAIGASLVAYFVSQPLVGPLPSFIAVNLPVGLAGLLISVYALAVRREALPQFLSLLMLDNAAFFAGIAIATTSALWEIVAALEGIVVTIIVALLTRTISERIGTTHVSRLSGLREEGSR